MKFHDAIQVLSDGPGHNGVYLGADHRQPIEYMAGAAVKEGAAAWVPAKKKETAKQ